MFLKDVSAWQATFLAPLHVVAKALGGGKEGAETMTTPDGKVIRSSLPAWHRKRGVRTGQNGAVVWDLDNDPQAEAALFSTAPVSEDPIGKVDLVGGRARDMNVRGMPKKLGPGNVMYEAVKRYGR